MTDFVFHVPTKVYFGRGQIKNLAASVKELGHRALLVYGSSSLKRSGLYDTIVKLLAEQNIPFAEIGGVEPNPKIATVRKGVEIGRAKGIDVVIAAGGGSAIDCAKAIAAAMCYEGDPWDLVVKKAPVDKALPIIAVVTQAGTGSDMSTSSVISDMSINVKKGFSSALLRPSVSILDPEYTYTVPRSQTAAGVADAMSHVIESYFNNVPAAYFQNTLCEAVMKTLVKYGVTACEKPADYEARANILWASSWAINGLLTKGNAVTWSQHPIENQLSGFYDITHGVGLAITTPAWLEYMLNDANRYRYVEYGKNVFDIDPALGDAEIAKQSIQKTREFFKAMGLPVGLREVGIDETHLEKMAENASKGMEKAFRPLDKKGVYTILKMAL